MKNLSKLFFALACIALTTTVTSCLDDDDEYKDDNYKEISNVERQIMKEALQGVYEGEMRVTAPYTLKTDTTACSWRVMHNDSTFRSTSFPFAAFSNMLSNEEDKNILKQAEPQELLLYYTTPNTVYLPNYQLGIYEYNFKVPTEYKYTVDTHQVTVEFASFINVTDSWGQPFVFVSSCQYKNKDIVGQLIVSSITIDDKVYKVQNIVTFTGKKVE